MAAAALLLAPQLPQASARGVSANLTASWPSSPFFPLLETSEFLAEENPAFFWQFVEILKSQTATITEKSANVDALAEFAVQEALQVAPASKNILELMLATRTYSVKVEMYRQLGLDSGVRPCGADADTWAVFYSEKQCVEAVACSVNELDAVLAGEKTSGETCIAAGVNDVELDVDHKYPQSSPTPVEKTAILYGVIGTDKFYGFHNKLIALAESNQLQYITRHFAKNSTLDTLLQGYGVALDIKNMEYKTIDDSKKNAEDDDAGDLTDEEENDQEGEEEDVEGFLFNVLLQRHGELSSEIKQFRDSLVKQDSQDQEVKAWHLKDLGLAAARDIIDAKHPLKRLQALSQDFPKHAKKLAFSRKPLSDEFREEIELRHGEAVQSGLMNKFLLNGIAVDPTQRSFNIFDFMNTLKEEWSVAKKLAALPLNQSELNTMLTHVRESNQAQQAVRIHIRGPSDGVAPFYLNDIENDPKTAQWPDDVDQLRRPAWNIIFIRKNMYEYVLVFDPTTSNGRTALNQIAFMRMRGAPLQWGLLISSKELLAAKTSEERELLIQDWKLFKMEDRANAWHFAKLLFLARAKDDEAEAKEEGTSQKGLGRIVSSFIEGVVDEGTTDITVKHLVTCYADSTFGLMARAKLEQEAISVLRGDAHDDLVLSMTDYIQKKHLPLESSLFNGVIRKDIDVQSEIMGHLGRDQALYQEMARNDLLQNDADLVEELLATQETVPAYFTIFDSKSDEGFTSSQNLLSHDSDAKIENLLESHVDYFHAANSLLTPKKQTLLFLADLGNPAHAGHVYQGVKAALEDSEKALRVGVVPRFGSSEDAESNKKGQLVASIISAVGTSDKEALLRFVMDTLSCIVRGKTLESMKSKLDGILSKIADEEAAKDDTVMAELKKLVGSEMIPTESASSQAKNTGLQQLSNILHGASAPDLARLYINGYPIDLPTNSISHEDMTALTGFDSRYRSQAVGKAFVKKSAKLTVEEANKVSLDIVKVCDLVDKYKKTDRAAGLELEGSQLVIRLPGDPALKVSAYLDPLSEATQMISSLLLMLHNQLNATVEVVLLPATDYAEFPLQRFYRYLFDKTPSLATPSVEFRKLPIKPILTMKIETPEAWNVQVHQTQEDLDNLRVDPDSPVDVKATKSAVFRLESLLVYGQCRDKTFDMYTPPNGLQLVLERDVGATRMHRDTLVMKNLGYFQLQATPGVWSLHLARGRATELFEIVDAVSDEALERTPVEVYDFGSRLAQLLVRKRKGREHDVLLDPKELVKSTGEGDVEPIAEDAGLLGSYWGSMLSLLGKKGKQGKGGNASAVVATPESVVNRGRSGETIHVFSLASGHLYERFLKIMMSSVLKRTKNPVTFWLLENFLSPDFKQSIPALREKFGMDIRLVTYKWPNWLRQQTQKQRIIWGYKILFLDVLFPLGVQKIIYVDADQVVRADLKELWEMDLQGAPYGYTPFCDSRNVGFQFWRQGYWKDHLRGRPYHISALYVVDLALFRQMAAGDMLRATYDQLSADPNSLSNLDQDLPNYTQHQIKIFSLPQEWLWCDSWCSDETKGQAKTIDLCNNPKHKEPKLEMAKRVISGELFPESWVELDQEIKDAEATYFQRTSASASTQ